MASGDARIRAALDLLRWHQLAVMRRIGSSQWEIDHALIGADGHHVNDWDYQDRSR